LDQIFTSKETVLTADWHKMLLICYASVTEAALILVTEA